MALETTVEQVDARVPLTVIALDGELDASNFESLIETARTLYDGGARTLLLDLTDLRFMASSGLVALHSIVRIMHGEAPPDPEAGWTALHASATSGSQREVQLCAPQPGVERVLARTGLDRMFVVHPDRSSAIAAF
ncbi:MAG: STAS domain-containing protein [Candidatus Limnocylindria bacterium]